MFAALDLNEVMMKALMGGILGGIGGLFASIVIKLTRKSDSQQQAEFERRERARIYAQMRGRPNGARETSSRNLLVMLLAILFVGTFVVSPSLVTQLLRRAGVEGQPDATSDNGKPSATISEYGRYRVQGTKHVVHARNASGDISLVRVDDVILLEQTDRIPCEIGEVWGIRIRSSDIPANRPCAVRQEMHHPPFKRPDGSVLTKSVRELQMPSEEIPNQFYGWYFLKGYEYELVSGEWSIVVFINDVEVARKSFNIRKSYAGTKRPQ